MDTEIKELQRTVPTLQFGTAEVEGEKELPATADLKENLELTPEEQKQVDEFIGKIDIMDSNAVMTYGAATQEKLSKFSEQALESVRTKDMGETGEMITSLIAELKNFDVDDTEKGLKALFHKTANKATALKAKYSKVETNVNSIVNTLETHQATLMKDVATLDQMYDMNLDYFHELTMYIAAGKTKLEQIREGELKELQAKAEASGDQQDVQAAKDMAEMCDRFEKKIYDLELTRTISLQTGPQIRMIQNADTLMAEKIQSTIVNTIPLWKNQMVIALGVEHAGQAAKAQREVTDMTNELLKKNADKLKSATVEAAKESERGIVEIETLKHTNETLISTLDEVLAIQSEGKQKRADAEKELAAIENQLKEKMLEAAKK